MRYFIFTVLPFGLTSAPFIFTKIMRVLVKYWRGIGIKIACFLDDGLGVSRNLTISQEEAKIVRSSLISAGFLINEEKSQWAPVQNIIWLGIEFSSRESEFRIPDNRVNSVLGRIGMVIKDLPYTSARELAKVCGKIISTKFVLGNIV